MLLFVIFFFSITVEFPIYKLNIHKSGICFELAIIHFPQIKTKKLIVQCNLLFALREFEPQSEEEMGCLNYISAVRPHPHVPLIVSTAHFVCKTLVFKIQNYYYFFIFIFYFLDFF